MTRKWRKCPACDGYGRLTIMKTRVNIFTDKDAHKPLLDDEINKCPLCKGSGQLFIKIFPFNSWGLFRKDKNE